MGAWFLLGVPPGWACCGVARTGNSKHTAMSCSGMGLSCPCLPSTASGSSVCGPETEQCGGQAASFLQDIQAAEQMPIRYQLVLCRWVPSVVVPGWQQGIDAVVDPTDPQQAMPDCVVLAVRLYFKSTVFS